MLKIILSTFILLLFILFPQITSADWPMFRNDYSHSGSSLYEITKQPTLIWSTGNIGAAQGSLNVDSDGTVYAGTSTIGLVAIDSNGNQKWTQNSTAPVTSSVFDSAGNIYFSVSGCNPFVYSFNKTGQKIWEYNLRPDGSSCGQFLPSGPIAISKDKQTLYTGRGYPGNTLMAINVNGTLKWEAGLSGQSPNGSLTIADSGNLYIGTGGNGRLLSLNESGIQRWSRTVGSGPTVRINTPILDENENVYVTTSGVTGGELLVSYNSAGTKRWQYQITNSVFAGSAAYKNGVVYIIEKTALSAIDATNGSLKWKWKPPSLPSNRSLTSPTVDKSGNILTTGSSTLYVISPEGQIKWSTTVADDLGSPVISDDNTIYTHQSLSTGGFIHKLKDTPDPTPTPNPTPIPTKTPLILIPGIGGSELKVNEDTNWSAPNGHGGVFNHTYLKDEKVWVNEGEAIKPGNDDYFDVLRMKYDGITSEASIGVGSSLVMRAYGDAINFFTSNGYELNEDFFVFPYDWRLDNTQNVNLLHQKIENIKAQTGKEKVDIIAHSMGGLISRAYISEPTRAQNVRKLFTLGTPHLGSVDALRNIRFGDCLTSLPISLGILCFGITYSQTLDVVQNMISTYQLVPTQLYYNFYSDEDNNPYPYKTDSGSLDYLQIKNLLTNFGHNTSLFNQSEEFHNLDGSLTNTNGIEVIVIAGSGKATLGQIIEEKTTSLLGIEGVHRDIKLINGDETVPLFSASLDDPSKNRSLLGAAKVYYTNQNHGNLVTDGPALNLVKNILEGNNELPQGASTQAYPLNNFLSFSVHSPVDIHLYDTNGNHTGPTIDGNFEVNIPESSYETLGDTKFVILPNTQQYNIRLDGTGEGTFDFKIREFENNLNTKSILYRDIPVNASTSAQTSFTTFSQSPVLQMDNNGDNIIDNTASASATLIGDENYDETKPVTTVQFSGTGGTNGWYKSNVVVSLNPVDEASGSGILKTEYTIDDQTIQTYTQPFTVSKEGVTKLKFKSTDKAGNEEEIKEAEIKIDKTVPEAKIFVDQTKQDMVVEGIDTNQVTIMKENNTNTKKKDDAIYTLTDIAGNRLTLDVRERDRNNKERFRIYSVQYNNNPVKVLDNNNFNVIYQGKKTRSNLKEQYFEVKGDIKIKIEYDQKKNISTITKKLSGQKSVKEIKNGLVILQLLTNKEKLETKY